MSSKAKLGIGFAVVIFIFLFFWFANYGGQSSQSNQTVLKMRELDSLILNNHDCTTVITEAQKFLASNPNAEEIWSDLGACQFYLGKFADAKVTFQKVLSLDPQSQTAKIYIGKLTLPPNTVAITGPADLLTQTELEKTIGFTFGNSFQFGGGEKRVASDKSVHISAVYQSNQSLQSSVSALKNELSSRGIVFTTQTIGSTTAVLISSKSSQVILTVTSINKLVQVVVKYIQFNE